MIFSNIVNYQFCCSFFKKNCIRVFVPHSHFHCVFHNRQNLSLYFEIKYGM
uniref:Uncharacterized protein n=1 Tax=Anguilla anguilla TaxID=7936 RepID=A0A0E9XSS5_ANGAN